MTSCSRDYPPHLSNSQRGRRSSIGLDLFCPFLAPCGREHHRHDPPGPRCARLDQAKNGHPSPEQGARAHSIGGPTYAVRRYVWLGAAAEARAKRAGVACSKRHRGVLRPTHHRLTTVFSSRLVDTSLHSKGPRHRPTTLEHALSAIERRVGGGATSTHLNCRAHSKPATCQPLNLKPLNERGHR